MSATFFIAMLIGILALLTLCRRIGWLRTCSLMVLWGVAADSHANSLVYAWWIVFGWMCTKISSITVDPPGKHKARIGSPSWFCRSVPLRC